MKRYLILGERGLLGSLFSKTVKKGEFLAPSRDELDIKDKDKLFFYFERKNKDFDVCVNFAAFTKVDEAEKERNDKNGVVWLTNVQGAKNVFDACQSFSKFLIHISTDFVFKGDKEEPGPYTEDKEPPLRLSKGIGWYAWTKRIAERFIDKNKAAILRVAFPFYPERYEKKLDFAKNILNLYRKGLLYPLFDDQYITPTYGKDLVKALKKIARLEKSGIYHVAINEVTTPYRFGKALLSLAEGKDIKVERGSINDFLKKKGVAPRPILGGLDCKKTEKLLGINFSNLKEALVDFLNKVIF